MPKKSRRAKAKHRAVVAKAVQERYSQQSGPLSTEIQSAPRVSPKLQDLASRYQYVIPEVKRIGIIAGSIILILIILSFVIG
jgi:Tfp pilus assembly protein PilE